MNNMRAVFNDSSDIILLDVTKRQVDSKLYRIWYGDDRYILSISGKQPKDSKGRRMIWRTNGWITNVCKKCAYIRLHLSKNEIHAIRHVATNNKGG